MRIRIAGKRDFDAEFSTIMEIRREKTRTDKDGNYAFENLPAATKLSFSTYAPHDPDDYEFLGEAFLQPGKDRPVAIERIEDGSAIDKAEDQPRLSLQERFTRILRDCRINGYQMMVVRRSGQSEAIKFVDETLLSYRRNKDVARFMPLLVFDVVERDQADTEFIAEHGWPQVSEGQVFVGVYDSQGREIDRAVLDITADEAVEGAVGLVAPISIGFYADFSGR